MLAVVASLALSLTGSFRLSVEVHMKLNTEVRGEVGGKRGGPGGRFAVMTVRRIRGFVYLGAAVKEGVVRSHSPTPSPRRR